MTAAYDFHPLADIFPLIEGAEFDDLVADIRAHGLHEPVVLFEEMILDGRNRYRACVEAGTECRFETYQGKDPVGYVVSLNLRRRHLNESQRAMVAAKLETFQHGGGRKSDQNANLHLDREHAASLLNVSERSVASAAKVIDHGILELQTKIEQGVVSISAAADVVELSQDEQREIVARGEREILETAKNIRARRVEANRAARFDKLAEMAKGSNGAFPNSRFVVVYADPPWHFECYSEESGIESAAAAHYPTMRLEEICALPVRDLATDSAVLFLWTTAPHLRESFEVLAAWRFEYKTNIVWVKDRSGLGYVVRNQHELLIVATRGDIPAPSPANRPASVISAKRREHSRKPDETYALIERMYPDLPKLELFARHARPGWDCWGNEVAPTEANGDGLDIPECLRRTPKAAES
jgi:N6-adenosine-specific RNA methylase IME4